ncbi:MAG: hypothetical protein RIE52_03720 [Balneola sp.]|jgi:hypothetical protein
MFKAIFTLLLTLVISKANYGQFLFNNVPFELDSKPENSFLIKQMRENEMTKIEEFDDKGNLIFQYIQGDIPPFFSWSEPHFFIYAFEYDEVGNIVKRYAFNSNAGHNIYEYETNSDSTVKTIYVRNYPERGNRNTNAYSNISEIKNFSELLESTEVITMMSSEKLFLKFEYLNNQGKPIQIDEYSYTYRDSIQTRIEYDKKLNELWKKVITSDGEVKREINYDYPNDETRITKIINYRNGKESYSYQSAKVTDKENDAEIEFSISGEDLNIRFYQYENGKLVNIRVYKTEFSGDLIVPLSNNFEKTAQMVYSYNELGLLEKERMDNYETGEKEIRTYKYEIDIN